MKFITSKYKIILAGIIILVLVFLVQTNRNLRQDNQKQKLNAVEYQSLLKDSIETFKVNDSISAVHTSKLALKVDEMERNSIIDKELLADLNIKLSHIKSYGHTEAVTVYTDTIVLKNIESGLDTLKTFKKIDRWHSVEGTILDTTISLKIIDKLELEYIEHWTKKKFLFIPLGKKRDSQMMVSKNPNTKITKSVFITNY